MKEITEDEVRHIAAQLDPKLHDAVNSAKYIHAVSENVQKFLADPIAVREAARLMHHEMNNPQIKN
jgi:hypothetical protein|tara:strand:- start:283 stop:480 length:198 start_codon:yes stop_codon:yes gene_type:complete